MENMETYTNKRTSSKDDVQRIKVWFDLDCELILSTMKDICVTCEEMFCLCNDELMNEVKQHRLFGCSLTFVEQDMIKTIRLYKREGAITRLVTVNDIESRLLKEGMAPNFAYGVARIMPLKHKVVRLT